MIGLILKQTTHDGRSKVWKLSQHKTRMSFGSSRKADLLSIDETAEAFHAVFELRDSQWYCITFGISDEPACKPVQNSLNITLPNSKLSFEVHTREAFIHEQLHTLTSTGTDHRSLVMVTYKGQVLETELAKLGSNYNYYNGQQYEQIPLGTSDQWQEVTKGEVVIKSRKISVQDNTELSKARAEDVWDEKSKKGLAAVLGLTILIVGVSFFAPKSTTPEVQPVQKISSNVIIKSPAMKKKKTEAVKPVAQAQSAPASTGGGKASAAIKSAIGVRISQLLGKVSATEARTNNVLVATKGIKAGEGPSGRALAAVGKIESSGRNWNGESVGKGGGIGTAGVGGGNGTKGLGGGLGQGKTGSGGVGLIEEESEIVGGLDREVIAQYIRTQLGQILYCYERQLSASPDLFGKIAVRFTIAGTGFVETQTINDTTLKSSSVENCILNKISKWKFPEPKGGTKVLVTYPFLFKSTN
ncbi:MAG: hypothetical protein K0R29_587 [Pseudobdellovibrio sp.]|jgi:hypothetical protein|nr:hypothetical protein [Pseudobdellovibrio sp.]